jgi:protein-S-isoprenylcysteine O-methyltransferase Ste14
VVETVLFTAASLFFLWFSRTSLRTPASHGFYRFFAWECMAALFLLNAPVWFRDPFSPAQLASWLLLTGAAALAIHGIQLLRQMGRPDAARAGEGLVGFEKTTLLVTRGAYRFIRHPLYASLLLLNWGILLKDVGWGALLLALAATGLLVATAKAEEAENVRYFGVAYREYCKRTRMFIPFVF